MASSTATSAAPADCIKAIQHYVNKILKPKDKTKEISGMKCLLLDKETVRSKRGGSFVRAGPAPPRALCAPSRRLRPPAAAGAGAHGA
jgi:hypothetical protein